MGLPYTYDKNFNLVGPTVEQMFANKGFQKQIIAAVKLGKTMRAEQDRIVLQGYQAHGKGVELKDNPHMQSNRRELWMGGWNQAEKEYLSLLDCPAFCFSGTQS